MLIDLNKSNQSIMKKLILVCFHLMMFSLVYSQNFEFKDYTFDDTNMEVPLSLINENEVILQKIINDHGYCGAR